MPSENTTAWAVHYQTATMLLLDGLATPAGETFAYGHGEALAADDDAHTTLERNLAQDLARSIREAALQFGIRIKPERQGDPKHVCAHPDAEGLIVKTTLSPEKLARIHAAALSSDKRPFVDPHDVALTKKLLAEKGEEWAASVLLRDISKRSIAYPNLPWLKDYELNILLAADRWEWKAHEAAILDQLEEDQ